MKRLILMLLLIPIISSANNKIKFVVDGFYFELTLGVNLGNYQGNPDYEFYSSELLSDTKVYKEQFKHILRVELRNDGKQYKSFKISNYREAESQFNQQKTLLLVTFGEHSIIMSPEYHILKCYRNTQLVEWKNNEEIVANVETGFPSLYDTENFIINVGTDKVDKIQKPQ